MASSDSEFKHESYQDTDTIVAYLDALRDGFAKGCLDLSNEEQQMVLSPDGLLKLELKVRRKGERVKFNLRLDWKESKEEPVETKPLHIK